MGRKKEGSKLVMTLPPITNKQQEIPHLLYRFRVLNRVQIQTFLNHKDYKTINHWLKDLTEKNENKKDYKNTFQDRTIPARYHLAINGIRYLRTLSSIDKKSLRKFYRESFTSDKFKERCMFIADIFTALVKRYGQDISFFTQSDYPTNGVIRDVMPTFGFIKKEGNNKIAYICELFNEKQPRYFIRNRISKFVDFFEDEPDTRILFVCPNESMAKFVNRFTKRALEDKSIDTIYFKSMTYVGLKDMDFVSEEKNEE